MLDDFFNEQIDRLKKTYSTRAYPEERVKEIWKAVKLCDEEKFKKAISYLIAENLKSPVRKDILEAITICSSSSITNTKEISIFDKEPNLNTCSFCATYGLIFAYDKKMYESQFLCPYCTAHESLKQEMPFYSRFPFWDDFKYGKVYKARKWMENKPTMEEMEIYLTMANEVNVTNPVRLTW